jgi:hypothetical protein
MSLQTPNPTSIEEIQRLYVIKGDKEVKSFIESNPYLLDVLKEAKIKIDEFFSKNYSHLELKLFVSPEEDDRELIATIVTPSLTFDESFHLLENFDNSWWLAQPVRQKNVILFGILAGV